HDTHPIRADTLNESELLGEVVPVPVPAVGVVRGRLRRLSLDPAHPAVALVGERVDAADAGPEYVPGAEGEGLAVGRRLHLAVDDVVALLERMVVRESSAAGLVVDHE